MRLVVPDEVPNTYVSKIRSHSRHGLVHNRQVSFNALPPEVVRWEVASEEDHVNILIHNT